MRLAEELQSTYKIYAEDGIIYLTYLDIPQDGEEDVMQAQLVEKGFYNIVNQDPQKKYFLFVDVSQVSNWRYIARDSRKIYAGITGHDQIKRVAVYGTNILFGLAGGLISQASGRKEILKFFKNRDEALVWLRG